MSSTPVNQDPSLAPPPPAAAPPAGAPAADPAASSQLLDSAQIVQLLRHFPGVYQVSRPSTSLSQSTPSCLRLPAPQRMSRLEYHIYIRYVPCAPPRDSGGEVTAGARSRVSQVLPMGLILSFVDF